MNKVVELVEEKGVTKWLAEISKFGVVSAANQQWVNEVWFPKVVAAGLRRMAVVLPQDIFGKMSANSVLAKVTEDMHIKHFDDLEQAKEWLKTELN